jgi:hypothetical protein
MNWCGRNCRRHGGAFWKPRAISSQLIYAKSDRHLWAQNYERDLTDVVTLQGEVARPSPIKCVQPSHRNSVQGWLVPIRPTGKLTTSILRASINGTSTPRQALRRALIISDKRWKKTQTLPWPTLASPKLTTSAAQWALFRPSRASLRPKWLQPRRSGWIRFLSRLTPLWIVEKSRYEFDYPLAG